MKIIKEPKSSVHYFYLKKKNRTEKSAVKIEFYKLPGILDFKLHLPQSSKNYIHPFKSKIIESGVHSKKNQFNWITVERVIKAIQALEVKAISVYFFMQPNLNFHAKSIPTEK